MIDVALAGTGGMMPLPNRFLTAMLLRCNGKMILLDCGEGTQVTLKLLGWGFKNIDVICITHYHADHISGLPGLLLTIGNSGRAEPLFIYGPPGLSAIVKGLLVIAPELPYQVQVVELGAGEEYFNMNGLDISFLPLNHRVACYAYSFNLKRAGRFDLEKAKALELPRELWGRLQRGESISWGGRMYSSESVLGAPRKGIKITYCTDSRPIEELVPFAKNSDLFICEGLHAEEEKKEKAVKHKHMLFSEAAELAKRAGVKELWLTHYSPALTNPKELLGHATEIFENSKAGYDRMTKTLLFEENF